QVYCTLFLPSFPVTIFGTSCTMPPVTPTAAVRYTLITPPLLTRIEPISWLLNWFGAATRASVLLAGGAGLASIALATPILTSASFNEVSATCIALASTAAIAPPEASVAPIARPASHLLRSFMSISHRSATIEAAVVKSQGRKPVLVLVNPIGPCHPRTLGGAVIMGDHTRTH